MGLVECVEVVGNWTDDGNPVFNGEDAVYEELSTENKRLAAEEYLARLQETGGSNIGSIYNSHKAEIDSWGREHGFDSHNLDETQKMVEAWMEETGFAPEKPGWFKQICSRIKTWLRMHGFKSANTISDDEIMTVLTRAAQAEIRNRRYRDEVAGSRAAMIGEEGAAQMTNARLNLDNLRAARAMLDAGKDAKTIKLATGWEKGGDGKWRMEVPDLKIEDGVEIHSGMPLGDIADAPELFDAYPDLAMMPVHVIDSGEVVARYTPGTDEIYISTDAIYGEAELTRRIRKLEDKLANFQKGYTETQKANAAALGVELQPAEIRAQEVQRQLDELRKQKQNTLRTVLIHEVQHAIQEREGFARGGSSQDYSTYHRLAGEVEARNAQLRADMTAEQKRQSLLDETADVAPEDRIYVTGENGVSAMAEPFTENQKRVLLNEAKRSGLKSVDVIEKMLYGGVLQHGGNKVFFSEKNSHALKLHLISSFTNPTRGPVSFEEIEKYLPLTLSQRPVIDSTKNKRGKRSNKVRTLEKDGVKYTLVTSLADEFRSFYSNKKISRTNRSAYKIGEHALDVRDENNVSSFSQNANPDAKNNGANRSNGANGGIVRASVTPEEDAAYLDAVKRGDLDAALKMAEDAAVKAGAQKLKNPDLEFRLIAYHGMPVDMAEEVAGWNVISKSPYSFSYYNTDQKSWDYTPEGCRRVSDHWNFVSRGQKHCVTDVPVEDNTHWTLAEYHDGIWHVIKSEPEIWRGMRDEMKEVANENVKKAFPKIDYNNMHVSGAYDTAYAQNKYTNEIYGKIVKDNRTNFFKVQKFNGELVDVLRSSVKIAYPQNLKEAGGFAFFPGTNTIKSTGVTYDDDGNVIPLSQRFNRRKVDVRFSAGVMDEETSRFTAMFQPLVGAHLDLSGEEYAARLKEKYGIEIPSDRAKLYAKLAIEANTRDRFARYAKNAMEYFRSVNPMFDFVANFTGSESFSINPGDKHLGEDFSGATGRKVTHTILHTECCFYALFI